ncbi:MAG: sulfotransferase [Burkholderiales bacterium]
MARSTGYLFLLSHMRSYSSLLGHILGSHAEIDGYVEQLRPYVSRYDLSAMGPRIEEATGQRRRGRYLFDKILHNEGTLTDEVLHRPETRVLFLVREPAATIPSIVRVARKYADEPANQGTRPGGAVDYYVGRLAELVATSDRLDANGRALFVVAEDLIDDTAGALGRISAWLGLASPLEARYQTFPLTGVLGLGDPSPNIKAGRVLRPEEREPISDERIDIGPEVLAPAVEAHRRTVAILRARHAGGPAPRAPAPGV